MDMSDRRSVDEESMNRYDETRRILPTVGACVVFSLDPVDSLDPDVQKDVEAVAACKKLVTKKYVGLVSGVCGSATRNTKLIDAFRGSDRCYFRHTRALIRV